MDFDHSSYQMLKSSVTVTAFNQHGIQTMAENLFKNQCFHRRKVQLEKLMEIQRKTTIAFLQQAAEQLKNSFKFKIYGYLSSFAAPATG